VICSVLYPSDDLEEQISCSCCGISYTSREYKILKAADKLGFFHNEQYGIFCNFCFVEFIKTLKTANEKEQIIINVKDKKIIIDKNEY
jgi:hypothetical protein